MSNAEGIQEYEAKLKRVSEDFERDGYAVIKNFLSREEVDTVRDECTRLIKEDSIKETNKEIFVVESHEEWGKYYIDSIDKSSIFYEKKGYDVENKKYLVPLEQSVAKLAHGLHVSNPVFKKLSTSRKVKDVYKAVNYGDPTICQSMVIFKNPQVGGEYPPHQDASFLCTEPVHLSGIWLALDDATAQNGCLEFIPGSHKGPLKRRFYRTKPEIEGGSGLEWDAPPNEYDDKEFIAAEVKRGDAVILDGLVVHRSAPNTSDKSRWIYTFHVFDASRAKFCKDNWCQPKFKETHMPIYATN